MAVIHCDDVASAQHAPPAWPRGTTEPGGPLRILFLADAYFDDIPGGSRVVARELARQLIGRGHDVTFLVARHAPGTPDDCVQDGARVIRYSGAGTPLAFLREGRRACAKLWAEKPFDIVHTHFAYAALGPLRAVPRGTPRLRSFYGPWDAEGWIADAGKRQQRLGMLKERVKRTLRHTVEGANLKRGHGVVVLSEHSRREVISFGYPDKDIRLIPGGADVDRFIPAESRAEARRALGLPVGRTLLLSVRRLAPRMGLDNLIKAMPAIVAKRPDALLLIGGKGPEREHLERLTARNNLQNNVRLLGFIADDELAGYYQAADLFILPTLALEGFGLVTTEALACGTPVIGTPVGATPEILSLLDPRLIAGGTGPTDLAKAVLGFLEGDWARAMTPPCLHCFVRDHYTWERHADAVESLYQSLVRSTRGKRAIVYSKGTHTARKETFDR